MPELVTHASAAYISRRMAPGTLLSVVLFGSVLPDLCTRLPNVVFNWLHIPAGEDWVRPLHSPLPLVVLALLLSLLFEPSIRQRVFGSLMLGIGTHLLLDLLQKRTPTVSFQRVYERGYQWLFPISDFDFQIGLFGMEASLYVLPATLLLTWWLAKRSRGDASHAGGQGR